jgi:hypothetical protein
MNKSLKWICKIYWSQPSGVMYNDGILHILLHIRVVISYVNSSQIKHFVDRNRHYKISTHRSAAFVHRILHVDPSSGQVILKRHLECNGLFYPNLFTLYVDSTSNETRGVDYYSLPLRIFITGEQCERESDAEDGELSRIGVKVSEAKR